MGWRDSESESEFSDVELELDGSFSSALSTRTFWSCSGTMAFSFPLCEAVRDIVVIIGFGGLMVEGVGNEILHSFS